MPAPPPSVIDAILAGQTQVTRRVEIYEEDGITLWQPSATPRLVTGQVTVDYTRDERRNVDLTLDNDDGLIVNEPGQFWYDKVLKIFRGVNYVNLQTQPRVLVVDTSLNTPIELNPNPDMATGITGYVGTGSGGAPALAWSTLNGLQGHSLLATWNGAGTSQQIRSANLTTVVGVAYDFSAYVLVPNDGSVLVQISDGNTRLGTSVVTRGILTKLTLSFTATGTTSNIAINPIGAPAGTNTVYVSGVYAHATPIASYLPTYLQSIGFTDLTIMGNPGLNDAVNFDIVAASDTLTADMSATTAAMLLAAFNAGVNIFTISPFATPSTVPLINTNNTIPTQTATPNWSINQPAADTPFAKYTSYQANRTDSALYTMPSAIASGTFSAAAGVFRTNATNYSGPIAMYKINGNGARWFHYHAPILDVQGATALSLYTQWHLNRDIFLNSAIDWVFPIVTNLSWESQIGEFLIDKIVSPRAPRTLSVTGRDYTKKLLDDSFDNTTTFTSGILVDTVVTSLAALSGVTKFRLNGQGQTTSSTMTFDSTSSYWAAIKSICNAANLEVFFDGQGYLVTRSFFDPTTSPITLHLQTGGDDGNLVDWDISSDDSMLYNRVVVSGTSLDSAISGNIYQAVSENHEPSSPTSIENLNRTITYYYSSPFFTSNAQCQAYADSLLAFHALEAYNLNYTSLVFMWLEAGEIIQADLPNASSTDPDRFLSVSFTIPLTLDPMTGVGKRVTIVG